MTRVVRIDSVRVADDAISIDYTAGHDAVPATPSKKGFCFGSKAQLIAAVKALEVKLTDEDLVLFAIAAAYKEDNTLTLATLQSTVGKMVAVRTQSDDVLVRVS